MLNFGNNTAEALAWLHGDKKQDNNSDNPNVYIPKRVKPSSVTIDLLELNWGGTIVRLPGRPQIQ